MTNFQAFLAVNFCPLSSLNDPVPLLMQFPYFCNFADYFIAWEVSACAGFGALATFEMESLYLLQFIPGKTDRWLSVSSPKMELRVGERPTELWRREPPLKS